MLRYLQVLGLSELVTERLDEFRVDLQSELLDLGNGRRKVLLRVAGVLLHLLVPHIAIFELFGCEDHRRSSQLRRPELEQRGIKHGHFLYVLRVEEH